MYRFAALLVTIIAATLSGSVAAHAQGVTLGGSLPGPLPLFPPDNWWNADISQAAVEPHSDAFIGWIQASGRRSLHPDFGGDTGLAFPLTYGLPYVVVPGTQPLVPVVFDYDSESDHGAPGRPPGYPIPDEAKTQTRWIEGGVAGGGTSGDRHMLIVDRDNRLLYELYALTWNVSLQRWEAGSGAIFPLDQNLRRPDGWTSADAAGLAILPGLIRYDEVFGTVPIRHAFRVTVRATNGYVFPASHRAGSNPQAPPMGTRFRLKPGTDLSGYPPYLQRIFQAMKTHGLIVADNGADMFVTGAYDPRWDMDPIVSAFRTLYADDFEVVQLGWQPPSGDRDGDGLPDAWEIQFGLDPDSAVGDDGAGGDSDGDGRTNAEELAGGTHPRGFVTRYLAEGATGSFFRVRMALLNSGTSLARVLLRFQRSDGTEVAYPVSLAPLTHATVDPSTLAGLASAEFSTVVESDALVVVDRTMVWDARGYGSHSETAAASLSSEWFLAEGATHSGFDLFYLIQNPNPVGTSVDVTYLRPAPQAPVVRRYDVPAHSRVTVWVDQQGSGLDNAEVSAIFRTIDGAPILVERAMYLSAGGLVFGAGHESAAVAALAPAWFFAEGATGTYFDLFLLLANPNATDASVRVDYLRPQGLPVTKGYTVPANSRLTVWVDAEDQALAGTAVSMIVTAINGVDIVAERAMWWPGSAASWQEAHNSPGSTATGTRWAIADGEAGGDSAAETYVLVANTATVAGQVRVTVVFDDGTTDVREWAIDPTSRHNVAISSEFPTAAGRRFGVIVESLGASPVPIVVERAMYSSADGVVWAAGSSALATRLP